MYGYFSSCPEKERHFSHAKTIRSLLIYIFVSKPYNQLPQTKSSIFTAHFTHFEAKNFKIREKNLISTEFQHLFILSKPLKCEFPPIKKEIFSYIWKKVDIDLEMLIRTTKKCNLFLSFAFSLSLSLLLIEWRNLNFYKLIINN